MGKDFFPGFCSVRPEVLPGYGIIREASSEQKTNPGEVSDKKINGFLLSHNINSPGMSTERKNIKTCKESVGEWQKTRLRLKEKRLQEGSGNTSEILF